MRCAIVHYHELALKGRNREYFELQLIRNIRTALKDLGITQIENLRSRIRVLLPTEARNEIICQRLSRVCGIANFSLANSVPLALSNPISRHSPPRLSRNSRRHPFQPSA